MFTGSDRGVGESRNSLDVAFVLVARASKKVLESNLLLIGSVVTCLDHLGRIVHRMIDLLLSCLSLRIDSLMGGSNLK